MLAQYLGGHDRFRPECDLAYDNQLMVMLWSSLATRDVRLAERALSHRRAAPAPTSWVTYVRCHDDIGWAVSDADAAAAGIDGFAHRRFLADFYAGRFPGSFGRGALFQDNPATGDARISGMAASLCGIEAALEPPDGSADPGALTAAVRRLLKSMYAIVFSFGGVPLIYMGDELAMRSDPGWAADPAHAQDNRWMHRPLMDWDLAGRRHDPTSLEGRVFGAIRRLADARRSLLALRALRQHRDPADREPTGHCLIAGHRAARRSSRRTSIGIPQLSDAGIITRAGLYEPVHVHSSAGQAPTSAAAGSSCRPGASSGSPAPSSLAPSSLAPRRPGQSPASSSRGTPGSASRPGSAERPLRTNWTRSTLM